MGVLGYALAIIGGLGSLVCFIMVLVKMFQEGQTTLGIVCIVLVFCFGIGGIVAFVYGWMKHRQWGITNIMYAWTACIVLAIIGDAMYIPTLQFAPQPGPVVPALPR